MSAVGQCSCCKRPADATVLRRLQGVCADCVKALLQEGDEDELSDPSAPALAEGDLFRGYRILDLAGRGGAGFVYRAIQVELDRVVALKILAPRLAAIPEFTARFQREARLMAALEHPNIVRVFDFGRERDFHFLVMEYVTGRSMRHWIRSRPQRLDLALDLFAQICNAIEFAHGRGVVHRDVKPENVMIDAGGRAKVTDFGLAKLVDPSPGESTLTRPVAQMGTPYYSAPEQTISLRDVDQRADVYSLGVMLYELLTGRLPQGEFPPPSRAAGVDRAFDAVVSKALQVDPNYRYQNVGDLRSDLDRCTGASQRTRWMVGTAALLMATALVAGAAAYWIGRVPPVKQGAPVHAGLREEVDLMGGEVSWVWTNAGGGSGKVGNELVFRPPEDGGAAEATPQAVLLGSEFALHLDILYEAEDGDEPWIQILLAAQSDRPRAIFVFPEGDHSAALAGRMPDQPGWALLLQRPLQSGVPRAGAWCRFDVEWSGSTRRMKLSVQGVPIIDEALEPGEDLSGEWALGLAGTGQQMRVRRVGLVAP